jgi:hypothetical protein
VLVAAQTIPTGGSITEESLTTTQVAGEDTLLIPASQLDRLVDQYARVRSAKASSSTRGWSPTAACCSRDG